MTGLMLLFYFTGLIQDCTGDGLCENTTPNSQLLNLALNPQSIRESSLGVKILLSIEGLALIGAAVLALFYSRIELAILSTVAIYLFNLLFDFIAVYNTVREAHPVFAILLFAPLMVVYAITVIEWWRGND